MSTMKLPPFYVDQFQGGAHSPAEAWRVLTLIPQADPHSGPQEKYFLTKMSKKSANGVLSGTIHSTKIHFHQNRT